MFRVRFTMQPRSHILVTFTAQLLAIFITGISFSHLNLDCSTHISWLRVTTSNSQKRLYDITYTDYIEQLPALITGHVMNIKRQNSSCMFLLGFTCKKASVAILSISFRFLTGENIVFLNGGKYYFSKKYSQIN